MKKLLFIAITMVAMCACSGSGVNTSEAGDQDSTAVDTVVVDTVAIDSICEL